MELTDKEEKDIQALSKKHPEVEKVYTEYKLYKTDATRILHAEFNEMAKCLAGEFKLIREGASGQCRILTSDDKLYERVLALMTNSEKIFKGMRIGKEDISPEAVVKEKDKDKEAKEGLVI